MSKRSTYIPALTLNHCSANKDTTIIEISDKNIQNIVNFNKI